MLRGFAAVLTSAAVATSPWLAGAARATSGALDGGGGRGEAAAAATGRRFGPVRLLLTRHAQSCANVALNYGRGSATNGTYVPIRDPMISDCGAARSRSAGEALEAQGIKPDLVLSSSLTRAMETAALMFPANIVTPVPYISEDGAGPGNTPKDVDSQRERFEQRWSRKRLGGNARVDWRWMWDTAFEGEPRRRPSFELFLRFMENELLPQLPESLRVRSELTMAVVTHSHFLTEVPMVKELCSRLYEGSPQSNQVLELMFNFEVAVDEHNPGAAWEPLRAARDGGAGMQGLPSLITRFLPGWHQGPATQPRHSLLTLARGAVCRNIYRGQAQPYLLCRADVGEACERAFREELPPGALSITTWEDRKRAANDRAWDQWDADADSAVDRERRALRRFRCCVA